MKSEDIVVVIDIHGEEEKLRVLYMAPRNCWWCKSITKPHARKRKICPTKVLRNLGPRK